MTAADPGRHLLDRIDAREQALAAEADHAQARIDEPAARLRELRQEVSDLQVTRKTRTRGQVLPAGGIREEKEKEPG